MNQRQWVVVLVSLVALSTGVRAQGAAAPVAAQTFSLAQALRYALDHYPTVKAALEQVNASTANVDVARAAYLPRFDAIWQSNRATANNIFGQLLPQSVIPSISGPVLPSTSNDAVWGSAAGGLFSWEPFDFGLRGASVREAEASLVRARAESGLTVLAVQHGVGGAFLGVVSAQQAVAAAAADVERRTVLARAARVLADNQLRPGAESARADAELAAAQTRAVRTRQALAVARTTLAQVLGIAEGAVDVSAAPLVDTVPSVPAQSAPAASHPLVQSGHAAVELARARETVLSKTDWPRVYLQSSVFARGSGANPDGQFDGGADGLWPERANWAAGVQVIFPNLFDFTSLRARRTVAGALTRAEAARYDEAVLTVTAEQRTAGAMADAAREIAQTTPLQLAAARQSEAQARARYEAGLASITEVAEAQSLLAEAEYQDAIARVDVWRALLAQAVAQGSVAPFIESLGTAGVR